jgi:hypothetical protein
MKTVNITFEDDEFKKLIKDKGNKNWRDYMLSKLPDHNNFSEVEKNEDIHKKHGQDDGNTGSI